MAQLSVLCVGGTMVRKIKNKSLFYPIVSLTSVGGGRVVSGFRKGATIFSQGELADLVFYITKGQIKIEVASDQGKEAVIAIFGPGAFFGESCLTGQLLRAATATAVTESVVVSLKKSEMVRALDHEAAFAKAFTAHLLARNSRVEEDLIDQLFNSSEKRLARILLRLANLGTASKPGPIITKISQETLAKMIGTTRPRVSYFMNKFRKLGFIEYNRDITVHSSLLSVVLSD